MDKNNNIKTIDLVLTIKKLWENRRMFIRILPIVFILSCFIILCVPRTYTTIIKLAPELESSKNGSALSSIASSFGFNMNALETSDAISPILYPDLMEDNGFVSKLFHINVVSEDTFINTTYYDYIYNYQKQPWWSYIINGISKLFDSDNDNRQYIKKTAIYNPYKMSKKDDIIASKIRNDIAIGVDKKTGVITISATAQDPLICKTIADSTRSILQTFITNYRTNKARIDMDYYYKLAIEAKRDYEHARQIYSSFTDANADAVLVSLRSKQEDLENEMQLKFNTYSMLSTQYQNAKARVQERTPAFTIVKGASVPIKPSRPKRMLFVIGMMVLSFFILSIYSIKDYMLKD